jgi:hypothetical protein
MIVFIALLFLACLWIWGLRCVFSEGYILERAGLWYESRVPEWLYKPTLGCAACMSSVHGSLWYWTWGIVLLPDYGIWIRLFVWGCFCVCLCGLNFILLETIYRNDAVEE